MAVAKIIIQGTGLGDELENYCSNIIEERFPGVAIYSKEKYLNSNTTHLIVGRPNSTEKLLSSLASGGQQWILKYDYLKRCFGGGRFFSEESFQYIESKSTGSYFGTKKSREAMGRRFQKQAVVLLIPDGYVRSKIQRVIVSGGGKVLALTISHLLNSMSEEISYVITDPTRYEGEPNYDCYVRLLAEYRRKVLFVCPSYIESCLTSKNSLNIDKFNINHPEIDTFLVEQKNVELKRVPTRCKREGTPPLLPKLNNPNKRKVPEDRFEIEIPSPAFEPVESPETSPSLPEIPDLSELPLSSQLTAMMEEKRPEQSAFDRMIIDAISTVQIRQEAAKAEQQEKSKLLKEYLMGSLSEDNVVPLEKRKKLERDKRVEETKVTLATPEYWAMENDFKHVQKSKPSSNPEYSAMENDCKHVQRTKPSCNPEKKAPRKVVQSDDFDEYKRRLWKQHFYSKSGFEEIHKRHQAKDARTSVTERPRRRGDSYASSETWSRERKTPLKQEDVIDLVSDDDDVVALDDIPDVEKRRS